VLLGRSVSAYSLQFIKSLTVLLLLAACSENSSSVNNADNTPEQNAIIGGEAATASDAWTRSTVAIVVGKNDVPKQFCTGTLISPNLVLTAAHCLVGLRPGNVWVHFGEVLPKNFDLSQLISVQDFTSNEKFGPISDLAFPDTDLNDIALLLLKKKAPAGFTPVAIKEHDSLKAGEKLLLAGYGDTSDTSTVHAKGLNSARVSINRFWRSLIVLDQTANAGACHGDSGGPAYIETDKGLIVAGVTRGAHNKSPHCHAFTEYTNAAFFKDFILNSARELGAEEPKFAE
jgi:secreted trypsin-like serine protease